VRIGRTTGTTPDGRAVAVFEGAAYDVTGPSGRAVVAEALAAHAAGVLAARCVSANALDIDTVRLVAPVDDDVRILCAGFNYRSHATEDEREVPKNPTFFTRYASSIAGSGEQIVLPSASSWLDWEGEVAIAIGCGGRAISTADAMQHVGGYVCFGDHSVRDFQLHGTQATAGKNFDRSGAVGPWIVTCDEAPPVSEMEVETFVGDERMQHGRLSDLIFDVSALIAYASTFMALRPGDLIATGTPSGIGGRMDPPRWLRKGEIVTVRATGLGELVNTVEAEGDAS